MTLTIFNMIKLQDVIYIVGIKELFDGDICMYVNISSISDTFNKHT